MGVTMFFDRNGCQIYQGSVVVNIITGELMLLYDFKFRRYASDRFGIEAWFRFLESPRLNRMQNPVSVSQQQGGGWLL